jgi:hypothetical protein
MKPKQPHKTVKIGKKRLTRVRVGYDREIVTSVSSNIPPTPEFMDNQTLCHLIKQILSKLRHRNRYTTLSESFKQFTRA